MSGVSLYLLSHTILWNIDGTMLGYLIYIKRILISILYKTLDAKDVDIITEIFPKGAYDFFRVSASTVFN